MAQKPDGSQPRVLICEDDHETAQVIAAALNQKGMVSDVAPDMDTARSLLAGNIYMAMTLDLGLTGESGIILYRELRSMQASADLPVIVISAVADEARKTLNGAAVGIIDWLEKPIDMPRLYAAIAKIGHQMAERKPAILHVEDDEDVLKVISASLGDDVAVTPARSAAEARRMLREERFDLVILDLGLPDGSGADLISVIPLGTAVVIFSALEVDEALAARVTTALTKTKTSEIAIADLVKSLIVAAPLPGGTSAENASGR
jgi:DNA-binding response OmpR family regulator